MVVILDFQTDLFQFAKNTMTFLFQQPSNIDKNVCPLKTFENITCLNNETFSDLHCAKIIKAS